MVNRFKFTKKSFGTSIAYIAAISSLIASFTFAFALLHPVDVLKDWKLTSQYQSYFPGTEATFSSSVTKVMSVTGHSTRYIICTAKNIETRYQINDGKADRPLGSRTSNLTIVIPDSITSLPQTCHLNLHVDYSIYGFRSFVETVDSNNFQVISE